MTARATKKTTTAVYTRRVSKGETPDVRIRMYDVGFGDCFLLFIPTPDGQRKVLIDCGSIAARERSMEEIVGQIITAVTDEDGKARIDIIVATHRHRDHISGFADRRWNDVEVQEVWMPWTEELGNPQALRIRQAQTRLAAALDIRFQAMNADQALRDLAVNALANEEAMEMLHHGFAGMPRRRFLPDLQQHDHILRTSSLPGVLVHVLGPSHDEDVVRDMDPPAGQSYLRLAGDGTDIGKLPEPFSTDWVMESPSLSLSPEDEKAIQRVNEGREEGLAAQLDKAVNGTSLMLLFQIGEAYLLFPGDAQWGTWKAVLNDSDTQRLLDKVTFYKIGHHGSHNATPITFVEKHLSNRKHGDLWAMLSVRPYARWPDIPRVPLLDRLLQCTDKLARSDVDTPPEGFTRETDLWVETTIPTTRKEELRAPE